MRFEHENSYNGCIYAIVTGFNIKKYSFIPKFKDDAFQCQQFQDDAFQQFKDDTFHNRSYTASINENSVEQNYERMLSVDRNAEIQEYKNDIEKLLRVNNSLVLETAFLRKENIMRSNRLKEQEATILR